MATQARTPTLLGPALLGIVTPIVVRLPGFAAAWEDQAGPRELAAIAQAGDQLGYHHLTCSEHIALTPEYASHHGTRWWDPTATFGYLAALTEQIRFATHVLVLGFHHPLEIAKRYGTLDLISGRRLILGVGLGVSMDELDLFGVPRAGRGAAGDDHLRALRAITRDPLNAAYSGSHFNFTQQQVDPCVSNDTPVWIGGMSYRSLIRAVELGDGWAPAQLAPAQLREMLAKAADTPAWAARGRPLEVIAQSEKPTDPLGAPGETAQVFRDLLDAGATKINVRFVQTSLQHVLEQLHAAADIVRGLN